MAKVIDLNRRAYLVAGAGGGGIGTAICAMLAEAGATVIVTACPYCMTNIEDAIKVAGLEGAMEVIDLVELVDSHLS